VHAETTLIFRIEAPATDFLNAPPFPRIDSQFKAQATLNQCIGLDLSSVPPKTPEPVKPHLQRFLWTTAYRHGGDQ